VSWSAEPIDGRRVAVYRTKIVIEQVNVATSDLQWRGAVAEDPLQREHVAPVGKEWPSEGMAKDVRWASHCERGAAAEPADELLDASGVERPTTSPDEQRVAGQELAATSKALSEGTTGFSADRHHALATALPEYTAPTLDKVEVADSKTGGLAHAQACVEQEQHDRAVALGLLRTCIEGS
jgi:hypothetical protein